MKVLFKEVLIGKEYFWACTACGYLADTEHDNMPCHVCDDWHGCGRDCTLSKIYCKKCGTEQILEGGGMHDKKGRPA
jgi:hypothetical protein